VALGKPAASIFGGSPLSDRDCVGVLSSSTHRTSYTCCGSRFSVAKRYERRGVGGNWAAGMPPSAVKAPTQRRPPHVSDLRRRSTGPRPRSLRASIAVVVDTARGHRQADILRKVHGSVLVLREPAAALRDHQARKSSREPAPGRHDVEASAAPFRNTMPITSATC